MTTLQHRTLYREPGRYAGWPANYGMWGWGDDLVACFTLGYHHTETAFHPRDKSRPFSTMQARSQDGGLSWAVAPFPGRTPGGRALSADEHMLPELGIGAALDGPDGPAEPPGGLDFTQPDFALLCARSGLQAGVRSFYYASFDRCQTWQGPYRLPMFGQTGIAARTDYCVLSRHEALLFLTANKSDGHEGRVLCAHTADGGGTFTLRAFIGPEPGPNAFAIMPASLKLASGRILTAIRCRDAQGYTWIDLYASDDTGQSWRWLNRPAAFAEPGHGGNPPALVRLPDDRLGLIYGSRDRPYTICARLSADSGLTWSAEIVLRAGGGSHDLGYPRAVVRPDGVVVTVYYFNDRPDGDGERFIEAALWTP